MIIFIFTYKGGSSVSFESNQFQTIDEAETFYFSHSLSDEIVFQTSEGGISVLSKDVVEFILKEFNDAGIAIHYREYDFKMDGHVFVTKYNGSENKHYQVYEWSNSQLAEISHPYEIDENGKITELNNNNVVVDTPNIEVVEDVKEDGYESNVVTVEDVKEDGYESNVVTANNVEASVDGSVDGSSQGDGVDVTAITSTPVFELNKNVADVRSSTMGDEEVTTGDNKINQKFVGFREKYLDSENKQDSWENQIIEKMIRREQKLKEMADVLDKENEYLDQFKQDKLGV